MKKIDLQKQHKSYYSATKEPELVKIERACFLSITGKGDPSSRQFSDNIQALYTTAYALKFHFKNRGQDFTVAKLEGLWWYDETKHTNNTTIESAMLIPRAEWQYQLLIRMPEPVLREDLLFVTPLLLAKNKSDLVQNVSFLQIDEHLAVQALHVGPFDTELETLKKIQQYMCEYRLEKSGFHHEIYLSDFRKTPPDKLKTILREPAKHR